MNSHKYVKKSIKKSRKFKIKNLQNKILRKTNKRGGFLINDGVFKVGSCDYNLRNLESLKKNNNITNEVKRLFNTRDFKKYIPLFELKKLLNSCGISNYVIDDVNGNHIYFQPQIMPSDTPITHLKINNMTINMVGDAPKTLQEYSTLQKDKMYNFKKFIENTYKNTYSDQNYFGIYDIAILNNSNILKKIYLKAKELKLNDFIKFMNNYLIIRELQQIPDDYKYMKFDTSKICIIYHNSLNIIKFFMFINEYNLLLNIIVNFDKYDNIESPFTINDVSIPPNKSLGKKYLDALQSIINLPTITPLQILNLDKLLKNITYQDRFESTNYENYLVISILKLLRQVFNTEEKINNLISAFNYYSICNKYISYTTNKNDARKIDINKETIKLMNYNKNEVLLHFIRALVNFLINLKTINEEFMIKTEMPCNLYIQIFCDQLYYNYLQDIQNNVYLPISLYAYSQKYLSLCDKIDESYDIHLLNNTNFILIKAVYVDVHVGINTYTYNSCGEANLFNLINYLLFDIDKKKITQKYIELLQSQYPDNILNDIYTLEFIELNNIELQINYLVDKLNDFSQKIALSTLDTRYDDLYNKDGVAELKPDLLNSIKLLLKLFGIKEYNTILSNDEDAISKIKEIFVIFHKEIDSFDINKIISNNISFYFSISHAVTNLINNANFTNNYLINLLNDNIIIKKYIKIENKENLNLNFNNNIFKYIITLEFNINKSIDLTNLKNLTHLSLGNTFNQNIDLTKLVTLKKLSLGNSFDLPINLTNLVNLTHLSLGNGFNLPIDLTNFSKLSFLSLGNRFNLPIDLTLTNLINLKHLSLGNRFDKNIDLRNLKNLTELSLGDKFNQDIDLTIFLKLEYLSLGNIFNKDIDLTNLVNLSHLSLGNSFDKNIDLSYIEYLEHLSLGNSFDKNIDFKKLIHLKYLSLGDKYNELINLTNIEFLEYLSLGDKFNQHIDFTELVYLLQLSLGNSFNQDIDLAKLVNLEHLSLGNSFDKNIDLTKLVNLRHLLLGNSFDKNIDLSYIKYLEHLSLGDKYNELINLTKHLEYLSLGNSFNQHIYFTELVNLSQLSLGDKFNQDIDLTNLKNLTELSLGKSFNHSLDSIKKLYNLKKINIPSHITLPLEMTSNPLIHHINMIMT